MSVCRTMGIFSDVASADKAVHGLLAAGFTAEEVTVLCSDREKENHFREYEHQDWRQAARRDFHGIGRGRPEAAGHV